MMSILDFFLHLDAHLYEAIRQYGTWVYAILFAIVFCETGLVIMPFLPGDSLLFVVGALAAAGHLHPLGTAALLISAAILGDNLNYFIGRTSGHRLFSNPHSKLFRQDRLQSTHVFFEKHGGKTLVVARFVPIIRTFAPFVAGMGEMPYWRFLAFSVGGALLWVGSIMTAGYFLGGIEPFKSHFELVVLGIIAVTLLPVVTQGVRSWYAGRKKSIALTE